MNEVTGISEPAGAAAGTVSIAELSESGLLVLVSRAPSVPRL